MSIAIRSIIMALAIFTLVQQSFAITTGFGGESGAGSVSSWSIMSLGSDANFRNNQVMSLLPSGSHLTSKYSFTNLDGAWVNQYHQADSGIYHVAAYAYMDSDKVTTFDYSFTPSTTPTSASISEDLTAENARNLVYGGFAYNPTDYAAVQLVGKSDAIKYHNYMFSGSTGVSAQQSFSGTGCNLTANSWAERGNWINESKNPTSFNILNDTGGFSQWIRARRPNLDNATLALFAGQRAIFKNATVSSYDIRASLVSNVAAANQSANISSANRTFLSGRALKGIAIKKVYNKSSSDSYLAQSGADIFNGTGIKYSGSTISTSTNQSTTQKLNVASDESISIQSHAGYRKNSSDPDNKTFRLISGYGVNQNAFFVNATMGKNGYQSASYVNGLTATAIQSANITSANYTEFYGDAGNGNNATVRNITNGEEIGAKASAHITGGRMMLYSAKSTITSASPISKSTASASQTFNARSSKQIDAESETGYDIGTNWDIVNMTGTHYGYGARQIASLNNTTLAKNGYQSSASINGATATATATQYANISNTSLAHFEGGIRNDKDTTIGNILNAEGTWAGTNADIINGTKITYSAKAIVTSANPISKSTASVNQTLLAKFGNYTDISSHAGYHSASNWDLVNKTGTMSDYGASQDAVFNNTTFGKTGYQNLASINGLTITGTQSADVLATENALFNGGSRNGKNSISNTLIGIITNNEDIGTYAQAHVQMGKAVTYSARSAITSASTIGGSSASITQTLNAKSSKLTDIDTGAGYGVGTTFISVNGTGPQSHYDVHQSAWFNNATWGPKGYQSSATIGSGTATDTQSADVSAADVASFNGMAETGKSTPDPNIDNHEGMGAGDNAYIMNGKAIVYSAKSTVTNAKTISTSSASATQTLNAKSGEFLNAWSGSGYSKSINWDIINQIGTQSSYGMYESAELENITMGPKGYQSTASISGATVTASQSADILSADTASFYGASDINKQANDTASSKNEHLHAEANAYSEMGKAITYSATYTSDNAKQTTSATQNLNAKSAEWIWRHASASWYKNNLDLASGTFTESSYGAGCSASAGTIDWLPPVMPTLVTPPPIISVSMTGTNTDTVSATGGNTGQAKASQNVNANSNGGTIHRDIYADQSNATNGDWRSLYHADADTNIITDKIPLNTLNSLSGSSTSTVSVNTSATLSGSWTAKVAKEMGSPSFQNFRRNANAGNYEDDYANVHLGKYSKGNALSISFKESANAVKYDATAA